MINIFFTMKEILEYYTRIILNKIADGEYKVLKIDKHTARIRIQIDDIEYDFTLWIANPSYYIGTYDGEITSEPCFIYFKFLKYSENEEVNEFEKFGYDVLYKFYKEVIGDVLIKELIDEKRKIEEKIAELS